MILAESGIVGMSKNSRRTVDSFLNFVMSPDRIKVFKKTAMLRGIKQKMSEICGHIVGIRPRGFPFFLLAEDPERNAPIRSPLLFEHFLRCLRNSVSISAEVSNPLWAFPKKLQIPFRFCSNSLQELLGAFPEVSRFRFGHFLYISL